MVSKLDNVQLCGFKVMEMISFQVTFFVKYPEENSEASKNRNIKQMLDIGSFENIFCISIDHAFPLKIHFIFYHLTY